MFEPQSKCKGSCMTAWFDVPSILDCTKNIGDKTCFSGKIGIHLFTLILLKLLVFVCTKSVSKEVINRKKKKS